MPKLKDIAEMTPEELQRLLANFGSKKPLKEVPDLEGTPPGLKDPKRFFQKIIPPGENNLPPLKSQLLEGRPPVSKGLDSQERPLKPGFVNEDKPNMLENIDKPPEKNYPLLQKSRDSIIPFNLGPKKPQ